jgi:hypothetical protein
MKQKQEGACAVPDCKGIPSFGPILMHNDLTFKEAYLCVAHKELLVREVIEGGPIFDAGLNSSTHY